MASILQTYVALTNDMEVSPEVTAPIHDSGTGSGNKRSVTAHASLESKVTALKARLIR